MSSAYSTINNYADLPVYSPDVNFVIQGLQYKQQQYDHNREKLQTYFDQIASVDLAKGEDVQYFEQRLEQVREIANKYMSGDLSRSSVVNSVMRNLNQILDKDVMTAVTSTKILRSEQKAWQQLKEKDGDKFSQTNYEFAMQNANKWLNDGQRGTSYNGGGGVIEYDDYGMRLMKELPDQMKSLNKNWIETAPGSGMFIDQVTMEMVPRGAVESVMRTIVGEKGYNQMRIDAWGRYRNASEDDIKNSFESFHSSALDEANRNIDNLKSLLGRTSDEYAANRYKDALGGWLSKKAQLEAGTFDKVKASSGLQGVYTTLHINQFEDGILDAYSDDPHVTKREIDQNDLKTKEFQLKLEEFEYKKSRDARKDAEEAAKATAEGGAGGPMLGELVVMDYDKDGFVNNIHEYTKMGHDAINAFKTNVSDKLSGAQMAELAAKMPESFADIGNSYEVMLGGRKYTFDLSTTESRVAMEKFRSYMIGDHPGIKETRQALLSIADQSLESWTTPGGGTSKIDKNTLPVFGVKIEGDAQSGFRVVSAEDSQAEYLRLLQKQAKYKNDIQRGGTSVTNAVPLTEAEQQTLKMYSRLHLIGDSKLSSEQKREAYVGFRQEMYDVVGGAGFQKLPKSVQGVEYAVQNKPGATYYETSGGMFKMLNGKVYSVNYYGDDYSTIGEPLTGSELDRARVLISETNRVVRRTNPTEISSAVGADFKSIYDVNRKLADESAEKANMHMSQRAVLFNSGDNMYSKLATLAGLRSDSKEPITVKRVFENGKPTNKFEVAFSKIVKTGKDEDVVYQQNMSKPIIIDEAQAESIGLTNSLRLADNTPYNTSFTQPAVKSLGSSKLSETKRHEIQFDNMPSALNPSIRQVNIQVANEYVPGAGAVISNLYSNYDEGAYTFKLEPISGGYYVSMYQDGKRLHTLPFSEQGGAPKTVDLNTVTKLEFEDATAWKSEVFSDYIKNVQLRNIANQAHQNFLPR
jgi:hypothetical protein